MSIVSRKVGKHLCQRQSRWGTCWSQLSFEEDSKLPMRLSHGDFRRFLYEATVNSITLVWATWKEFTISALSSKGAWFWENAFRLCIRISRGSWLNPLRLDFVSAMGLFWKVYVENSSLFRKEGLRFSNVSSSKSWDVDSVEMSGGFWVEKPRFSVQNMPLLNGWVRQFQMNWIGIYALLWSRSRAILWGLRFISLFPLNFTIKISLQPKYTVLMSHGSIASIWKLQSTVW